VPYLSAISSVMHLYFYLYLLSFRPSRQRNSRQILRAYPSTSQKHQCDVVWCRRAVHLAVRPSLLLARRSGTLCPMNCERARATDSRQPWKLSFSLDTSVYSALDALRLTRHINSRLTLTLTLILSYNLRERKHNLLPLRTGRLSDHNFIQRMLYLDAY